MVNIDKVYQKVLAFANKEQRGYITPQEFNLFADQAQMEIFEQYFYDKNQFARVPGNNYEYSDMIENLNQKISIFERYSKHANVSQSSSAIAAGQVSWGDIKIGDQFPDLYRVGHVRVKYQRNERSYSAEKMSINDVHLYGESPLGKWSWKRPRYTEFPVDGDNAARIKVYPYPHYDRDIDKVSVSYIRKPKKPNWGYVVVNDKPLYNSNTSTDFELHAAEESELVYRILMYAGISIEKPQLAQLAMGLEQAKVQQEKQ